MNKSLNDYKWNYYVYNVINVDTGDMYETDDIDDAKEVYNNWSGFGEKIVIQQIHSVARIL